MYKNIGQKIKFLAEFCGTLVFGLCIIAIIIALFSGNFTVALYLLAIGILALISSWPLYGFGQLIEDVNALRKKASSPTVLASDELPEL